MASGLGTVGLRGVSMVMAGVCGLTGLVLSLFLIMLVVGNAYTMNSHKPLSWNKASAAGSASLEFQTSRSWTCPGRSTACHQENGFIPNRTSTVLAAAQLASMAPMVALAFGLLQACLCFSAMARGRFLHRRTVSYLMRFAGAGLFFVLASPLSGVIGRQAGVLVDGFFRVLSNDKSWSVVSGFGLKTTGVHGLLTIIYAVTLTVIAVVMVKASAIADDHAQIV